MMQVLTRHDALDAGRASVAAVGSFADPTGDLSGLRVGVVRHFFETDQLTDSGDDRRTVK